MSKMHPARTYQDSLNIALKSATLPVNVLAQVIRNKLLELGVRFNKKEYAKLLKQLDGFERKGSISFNLSDQQIRSSKFSSEAELRERVNLSLGSLASDIEKYTEKLVLPDVIHDVMERSSASLYKKLKKTRNYSLSDNQAIQLNFELGLISTWGKAFDALETLIGVAMESGELYVKGLLDRNPDSTGYKSDVLVAMHARCCQIAGEVLALLKTGFSDGAYARWRSLHEVTVIALFINEHDDELAERYFFHQDIETLRHLEGQEQRFPYLENDIEFQKSLMELKESEKELLTRFGQEFVNDFGWATNVLRNKKPTFRDIESLVNMDFLRPYYKLASMNVHAGSKGTFYRIGLVETQEPILLAGRSNVGFEEPGSLAGVSLTQVTIALSVHEPDLDQLVYSKVMVYLQNETKKEFDKSARKLAKRIKKTCNM